MTRKNHVRSSHGERAASSEAALAKLLESAGKAQPRVSDSLSEIAYQRLREAIHEGVFEPNSHLGEVDVARWLQMSRTPIRDAMRRLTSEGLLANQPYRGTVVAALSTDDIRELYFVRELLEVAAVGLCAAHAGESHISAMKEIIEAESRSLRDPRSLIDLNRRFHREIYRSAPNRLLQKILGTIDGSIALLGKSNLLDKARAHQSHREHRNILNAIEKRDRQAAERAARAHVRTSLKQRLKRMAADPVRARTSAPHEGGGARDWPGKLGGPTNRKHR